MTVMTNNYGENHPLVTTVSVGIPTTQILMLLMVCTYIISELTKFWGKKSTPSSNKSSRISKKSTNYKEL